MSNTFNIVGPPAGSPNRVPATLRAVERVEPVQKTADTQAGPRRGASSDGAEAFANAAVTAVLVTPPVGAPVGASSETGGNNGALATRALQSYRAVDDAPAGRAQPAQADTGGALTSRSGRLMAVTSNQDPGPAPLNVFLDALARAFSSASPTLAAVPPAAEHDAAREAAAGAAATPTPVPADQRAAQRQLTAYTDAAPAATPAAATPGRIDA